MEQLPSTREIQSERARRSAELVEKKQEIDARRELKERAQRDREETARAEQAAARAEHYRRAEESVSLVEEFLRKARGVIPLTSVLNAKFVPEKKRWFGTPDYPGTWYFKRVAEGYLVRLHDNSVIEEYRCAVLQKDGSRWWEWRKLNLAALHPFKGPWPGEPESFLAKDEACPLRDLQIMGRPELRMRLAETLLGLGVGEFVRYARAGASE
jgi:hypothetical protein